jgi:hypothetical protein
MGGFLVAGLFEYTFGDSEVVMVVYALMALPFVVARAAAPDPPDTVPVVTEHAGAWLEPRRPWWSPGTATTAADHQSPSDTDLEESPVAADRR